MGEREEATEVGRRFRIALDGEKGTSTKESDSRVVAAMGWDSLK